MPPKMMVPDLAEIQADALDRVHRCCARLQIPNVLRDAIGARLGAPQADFSVQFLTPLSDAERENTVENVDLQDAQGNARPPSLFERAQMRSLFLLADQVAATLLGQNAQAQSAPVAAAGPQLGEAPPGLHIRRIKVSDVLDPMDEGYVDLLTPGEFNAFFDNYPGVCLAYVLLVLVVRVCFFLTCYCI